MSPFVKKKTKLTIHNKLLTYMKIMVFFHNLNSRDCYLEILHEHKITKFFKLITIYHKFDLYIVTLNLFSRNTVA